MRKLKEEFISDLKSGQLKDILIYIHKDNTLDLQIRENYINIYYRGGNILRIKVKGKNQYKFEHDENYVEESNTNLIGYKNARDWNNYFPMMKQEMDFYFTKHRKEEREYQQLVVKENNYSSLASGSDYFIIDTEYDNHNNARFDLIAVEWPSEASKRKLSKNYEPKLLVIEMKYGDKALSGKASINKHYEDFSRFLSNPKSVNDFKNEMIELLKQKRYLGLIPCLSITKNKNEVSIFAKNIELAFLIVNHDPESKILKNEITKCKNINPKFIVSNFMGYGIYNHSIFGFTEFTERYRNQFSSYLPNIENIDIL